MAAVVSPNGCGRLGSEAVKLPAVSVPAVTDASLGCSRTTHLAPRRKLCSKFLAQSQLVVVEFGWLEETPDLLSPFHIGSLGVALLLFLLDDKKLCIIPCELLERNQKVSEVEAELVVLRVEAEEALNEARNLRPICVLLAPGAGAQRGNCTLTAAGWGRRCEGASRPSCPRTPCCWCRPGPGQACRLGLESWAATRRRDG